MEIECNWFSVDKIHESGQCFRWEKVSDDTISRRANWSYSPVLPIKKRAKKLVMVITPNPPICTSRAITISPSVESVVARSTGESPVTQTALVDR